MRIYPGKSENLDNSNSFLSSFSQIDVEMMLVHVDISGHLRPEHSNNISILVLFYLCNLSHLPLTIITHSSHQSSVPSSKRPAIYLVACFKNYPNNTRHVCTYFNAFLTTILNMVAKFDNF